MIDLKIDADEARTRSGEQQAGYSEKLQKLYENFGYRPYKMSKFEEYELYLRNKEFLISDAIITFTDTDGRLMALKPDVTLSIIKNTDVKPGATDKLYYSENVYRVAGGSRSGGSDRGGTFREIMQTGLECIGAVDNYCLAEVLLLATGSLELTGRKFVLDVGQLDLLFEAVDRISPDPAVISAVLRCVEEKNIHEIAEIAAKIDRENLEKGAGTRPTASDAAKAVIKLVGLYGKPDEILPEVEKIASELGMLTEFDQFKTVLEALSGTAARENLRVDFSIVSDRNYYNGIAFKGYVEGVPERVLSGGCYDRLAEKLSKKGKAIGFAVYLDVLERLWDNAPGKNGQLIAVYGDNTSPAEVFELVREYAAEGASVRAMSEAEFQARQSVARNVRNGGHTPVSGSSPNGDLSPVPDESEVTDNE